MLEICQMCTDETRGMSGRVPPAAAAAVFLFFFCMQFPFLYLTFGKNVGVWKGERFLPLPPPPPPLPPIISSLFHHQSTRQFALRSPLPLLPPPFVLYRRYSRWMERLHIDKSSTFSPLPSPPLSPYLDREREAKSAIAKICSLFHHHFQFAPCHCHQLPPPSHQLPQQTLKGREKRGGEEKEETGLIFNFWGERERKRRVVIQ